MPTTTKFLTWEAFWAIYAPLGIDATPPHNERWQFGNHGVRIETLADDRQQTDLAS